MASTSCQCHLDVHFVGTLTPSTVFFVLARAGQTPRLLINRDRWAALDAKARWALLGPFRGEQRERPPDGIVYAGHHQQGNAHLGSQLAAIPEATWARIVAACP